MKSFLIYLVNLLVHLQNRFLQQPEIKFDVESFVDDCCKTPVKKIHASINTAILKEKAVKLRQCLNQLEK